MSPERGATPGGWHPWHRPHRWHRWLPWLSAAVALLAGGVLAAAVGIFPSSRLERADPPAGTPLIQSWRPPPGMPSTGLVGRATIPGTVSHFTARPARVYLPPAARTPHPPKLPVLLLLPGVPGPPDPGTAPSPGPGSVLDMPDSPDDWFTRGGLAGQLDGYAQAHHGLAPIVVVADPFGTGPDDPLCADSQPGNAATYLTRDVPAWVHAHLPARVGAWAVGGYASGGTCAVQLALRDPKRFPTFVDLSGQDAPTVGSRELTITRTFAGDATAYARINPADIVALQRFPEVSGVLAVGRDDVPYNGQTRAMWATCLRGGMSVQFYAVSGGHDWTAWRTGLELSLEWLGARLGLT